MNTTVIRVDKKTHLSEVDEIKDIWYRDDHITVLAKGTCGNGGTTMVINKALEENKKVVVTMPTVSAVKSKEIQYKGQITALYGKKEWDDSKNIICCTYDKLVANIQKVKSVDTHLVLDEFHTINRDTSYRDCMSHIFECIGNFKSVNIISATPDDYFLQCLQRFYAMWEIDYYQLDWMPKTEINVIEIKNKSNEAIKNMINKIKVDDNVSHNLYFLINDVEKIKTIITDTGLQPDDYKILASKSKRYKLDICDIDDFGRDSERKRYNFITLAGYEGCDIWDENGQMIFVWDAAVNTTMIDVNTIIQAVQRVRDTKISPVILYHPSKLREDQVQEINHLYEEMISVKNKCDSIDITETNQLETFGISPENVMKFNDRYVANPVKINNVRIRYNTMMMNNDVNKFLENLNDTGLVVAELATSLYVKKMAVKKKRKLSFKKVCQLYEAGISISGYLHKKLVENLYATLGKETIQEYKYDRKKLECMYKKKKDNKLGRINDFDMCNLRLYTEYTADALIKAFEDINEFLGMEKYPPKKNMIQSNLFTMGVAYKTRRIKEKNSILYYLFNVTANGVVTLGTKYLYRKIVPKVTTPFAETNITSLFNVSEMTFGNEEIPCYEWDRPMHGIELNDMLDEIEKIHMSISTKNGVRVSHPMFLSCEFNGIFHPRPTVKENGLLISECYNDICLSSYPRSESSFQKSQMCIFDVDEGYTIDTFLKYMHIQYPGLVFGIFKTFSYREDHHKFRVLVPIDRPIDVTGIRCKAFKSYKTMMIPAHDPHCQLWTYGPSIESGISWYGSRYILDSNKISTWIDRWVEDYNARYNGLLKVGNLFVKKEEMTEEQRRSWTAKNRDKAISLINNSVEGERDKKIFIAVKYYMEKEDIEYVRSMITDPEKIRMFDQKVRIYV